MTTLTILSENGCNFFYLSHFEINHVIQQLTEESQTTCRPPQYRTTSKVHLNRPNLIYLNRPHSNDTNLKQISCDHCNFKSFTMYDIENHMKSYCPRRQIFTCSDCKEDFSQKKNLTAHMQSAHGRKRLFFDFKCPECNFSAMNKSGLMNHIRMSHLQF